MEFQVATTTSSVDVWSDTRLPFEPKGTALAARTALRGALRDLRPTGRLAATYSSAVRAFCDVENVLVYNVGTGPFSELARRQIVLRRSFKAPKEPFTHHHHYETLEDERGFRPRPDAPISSRVFELPNGMTASGVWAAAREAAKPSAAEIDAGSSLHLEVDIGMPAGTRFTLASSMKVLLDGLVASFHRHVPTDVTVIAERIASRTLMTAGRVSQLLLEGPCELGERRVVQRLGSRIQWNPADDRFVVVDLRVREAPARLVEARLFEAMDPGRATDGIDVSAA
jgi:hypothetical protein